MGLYKYMYVYIYIYFFYFFVNYIFIYIYEYIYIYLHTYMNVYKHVHIGIFWRHIKMCVFTVCIETGINEDNEGAWVVCAILLYNLKCYILFKEGSKKGLFTNTVP